MADDNSEHDATQDDVNEGEQANDASTGGDSDTGAGADDSGEQDEGAKDDAADEGGDDKGKSGDGADDDDKEPPVRRGDASRFIIARQQRKIAKLQGGGKKSGSDAGEGDTEDDDISPEDAALVDRVLDKRLKPLEQKLEQDEDNNALNQFFADAKNAHFKPYEAKIRKWAVHPTRKNLPIRAVALEIAGDDLMKIGAQRGKEADTKAKKDQAGGGNARQEPKGADAVWGLPQKDFEAQQEAVRRKGSR